MAWRKKEGPLDYFAQLVHNITGDVGKIGREAVADVRDKVVLEPWFGRQPPAEQASMSEQLGWSRTEVSIGVQHKDKSDTWNALYKQVRESHGPETARDRERDQDRDYDR